MRLVAINGMLPLPARPTEILETLEISAKVWSHNAIAHGAEGVLQVRVDLDLGRRRICGHTAHNANNVGGTVNSDTCHSNWTWGGSHVAILYTVEGKREREGDRDQSGTDHSD